MVTSLVLQVYESQLPLNGDNEYLPAPRLIKFLLRFLWCMVWDTAGGIRTVHTAVRTVASSPKHAIPTTASTAASQRTNNSYHGDLSILSQYRGYSYSQLLLLPLLELKRQHITSHHYVPCFAPTNQQQQRKIETITSATDNLLRHSSQSSDVCAMTDGEQINLLRRVITPSSK